MVTIYWDLELTWTLKTKQELLLVQKAAIQIFAGHSQYCHATTLLLWELP